ncbi:LCP family protein [Oceanobacillus manasiensis]|uniref:LCP family protein n=1 Tax=Oceanobacillus manasiensis TaxID=586413 RepID=UPI0005A5D2E8|nr:LCP family protein [Oceanobacillus manasiensis]
MGRLKKRSKRKRRIKLFFLTFVLLVGVVITYSIIQFNQGLSAAKKENTSSTTSNHQDFTGEEVKFGEIKVLLIGSDAREGEQGRSDTLMIGYYNQNTHDVKLVSLMRDIYVDIPGYGMNKLNAAYSFGGPELLRQTIKQNFDTDINYYATVDFNGFPKIIDLIVPDGLNIDVAKRMSKNIGMTLEKGEQTLHGEELLGYVRFRKDSESDFGRVRRQQEVLSKLKDEAISINSIVNLPKTMGVATGYVDTNISNNTLFSIGKGLLTSNQDVETLRLPVDGSFTNQRVNVGAVLDIDLDQNKQALKDFFSKEGNLAQE